MNGSDMEAEMLEAIQPICYSELCNALQELVQDTTTISTVKDMFSVFWNYVHKKGETDDELKAKTEILHIAVEAYEQDDFSKTDLQHAIAHFG